LYGQSEDVDGSSHYVGRGQLFVTQDIAEGVDDPSQCQGDYHDQIGGDKDRITHLTRDSCLHIAAPRQRIVPEMLQDSVECNRNAGYDDHINDSPDLFAGAQGCDHDGKYSHV